jgi:hypothetical protein
MLGDGTLGRPEIIWNKVSDLEMEDRFKAVFQYCKDCWPVYDDQYPLFWRGKAVEWDMSVLPVDPDDPNNQCFRVSFVTKPNWAPNPFWEQLKDMGWDSGVKVHHDWWVHTPLECRLAFLGGWVDTDGWKHGNTLLVTQSEFHEPLLLGLGAVATSAGYLWRIEETLKPLR